MNWERGLFRLWIVLAVVWVIITATLGSQCFITEDCAAGADAAVVAAYVMGVPAGVLFIGAALVWAIRGFKRG